MCVDASGSALADERRFPSRTILTVSNYEYIFAYKLNQSGGIELETRATGILSVKDGWFRVQAFRAFAFI